MSDYPPGPYYSPQPHYPPQPPRRRGAGRAVWWFIGVTIVVVGLTTMVVVMKLAAALTPEERGFVRALRDPPCSHKEIFDLNNNCDFGEAMWVWEGSEKQLADEGHDVCTAERNAPAGSTVLGYIPMTPFCREGCTPTKQLRHQ